MEESQLREPIECRYPKYVQRNGVIVRRELEESTLYRD